MEDRREGTSLFFFSLVTGAPYSGLPSSLGSLENGVEPAPSQQWDLRSKSSPPDRKRGTIGSWECGRVKPGATVRKEGGRNRLSTLPILHHTNAGGQPGGHGARAVGRARARVGQWSRREPGQVSGFGHGAGWDLGTMARFEERDWGAHAPPTQSAKGIADPPLFIISNH